jgi:peroxiredoxin
MQVGMMKQVRAPSVKHGEKADLGAQVLGISGDGEQGLRRGSEKNAIELSLILVGDGGNLLG